MKVTPLESGTGLTVGLEYPVLGLEISTTDGVIYVRLWTDDDESALHQLRSLTVVDSRISPTWSVLWDVNSESLSLYPAAWNSPGFWDSLYNEEDPDAMTDYRNGVAQILGED
jgi:hypothetical protein